MFLDAQVLGDDDRRMFAACGQERPLRTIRPFLGSVSQSLPSEGILTSEADRDSIRLLQNTMGQVLLFSMFGYVCRSTLHIDHTALRYTFTRCAARSSSSASCSWVGMALEPCSASPPRRYETMIYLRYMMMYGYIYYTILVQ